jgi:hypothetical protein
VAAAVGVPEFSVPTRWPLKREGKGDWAMIDREDCLRQNRAHDRNPRRETGPHQTAAQCVRHVVNKSCAHSESAECQPPADQSQQYVHLTKARLVARPGPPEAEMERSWAPQLSHRAEPGRTVSPQVGNSESIAEACSTIR